MFWASAAIIAAAAQTARNAMQRKLTAEIGTVGATQVRFLYGFPFALLFLGLVAGLSREAIPTADLAFIGFAFGGAVSQILATALMLLAMKERSFSVTTAYTKTEPVQVAIFGSLVLGDHLSLTAICAIILATIGVVLMAVKAGEKLTAAGLRPALAGIAAGGLFALAAIFFRGGILELGEQSFVLRASTMLAWSLGLQTLILVVWMLLFDRRALTGSVSVWRSSLFAGFMGAFASQFWFIGFSLTAAANVRTLGLVEVFFAQIVTRKLLSETTSRRELIGMAMVLIGVGALLIVG
ncbi:MAG: DMT family transporter [Alphaproteobacteria bacterium]|nr:DMT family transporter [Alphaproteobacteria bacterium]